jgi:hypothetical protein
MSQHSLTLNRIQKDKAPAVHSVICGIFSLGTMCLFIYLWLYSPFYDLGRLCSFFMFTQSVGLPGRAISRRKAATCTQDSTNTE